LSRVGAGGGMPQLGCGRRYSENQWKEHEFTDNDNDLIFNLGKVISDIRASSPTDAEGRQVVQFDLLLQ
jgi:hypothetical protein